MATAAVRETKSTTKSGRKNKVGNFFVDKINREVMLKFIAKEKLEIDTDLETEQLGVALSMYFQTDEEHGEICECDQCNGQAPEGYSPCPLCGLKGEVLEAASDGDEEKETEEEEKEVEEEEEEDDGDIEGMGGDEEEPTKEEKMSTTTAVNGTSRKMVKVTGRGAPLASSKKHRTVKDLDKAIAEYIELKSSSMINYFAAGHKILEINESNMWRLRIDEKGKPRYKTWEAFVNIELKCTPAYSYDLMNQARGFTPKEVEVLGRSKATLIMRAPPEDRERLKAGAQKMGKRELAAKVKEAKKKRNYTGESKKAKAGSKGAAAKAKNTAKREDKITIASIEGRKTIKFYMKPARLQGVEMKDLKRAKTIKQQPFARLELANEVVMTISLQETDSGIIAVVDTRRETGE